LITVIVTDLIISRKVSLSIDFLKIIQKNEIMILPTILKKIYEKLSRNLYMICQNVVYLKKWEGRGL